MRSATRVRKPNKISSSHTRAKQSEIQQLQDKFSSRLVKDSPHKVKSPEKN
jgi:hypothetical protein